MVQQLDAEIASDGNDMEIPEVEIFKPGDSVNHSILGEGNVLDYNKERDTYKIDFNGAVLFIRADYFSKS